MIEKDAINKYIISKRLSVYVKPNKSKSRVIGWDNDKNALVVEINAPPKKGEANIELLKLLNKTAKKQWRLVSGYSSRKKVVEIQ